MVGWYMRTLEVEMSSCSGRHGWFLQPCRFFGAILTTLNTWCILRGWMLTTPAQIKPTLLHQELPVQVISGAGQHSHVRSWLLPICDSSSFTTLTVLRRVMIRKHQSNVRDKDSLVNKLYFYMKFRIQHVQRIIQSWNTILPGRGKQSVLTPIRLITL